LLILNVATSSDVAAAFSALIERRAGALMLSANILFQQARGQIISLAAHHAMPTMFWDSISAAAGALSSYGPNIGSAYHQTGLYTGEFSREKNQRTCQSFNRRSSPWQSI
jgi:putative ABC transport system substrate-binding protein